MIKFEAFFEFDVNYLVFGVRESWQFLIMGIVTFEDAL